MQRGGESHCTLTGFHWRRWGTRPVKNCSTRDSAGVGSETQGGIRHGRKKAGPQCTKGKGHGEPLSQPMSQLPHVHEVSHGRLQRRQKGANDTLSVGVWAHRLNMFPSNKNPGDCLKGIGTWIGDRDSA